MKYNERGNHIGRTRGMKGGQACWMIEKRDISGRAYGWLCWEYDAETEGWGVWTQDPNKALHFADQASCDQMCAEMPDDWDIRITDHQWMGSAGAKPPKCSAPTRDRAREDTV